VPAASEVENRSCGDRGSTESPPCCKEAGGGPYRATVLTAAVMLSIADHSVHGYELLEKVKALVGHMVAVDKGSVYRLLRSFEQQGQLSSDWEDQPSGPHRRVYRLTPNGIQCLQAISDGLKVRADCLKDLAKEADERLVRMMSEAQPVESPGDDSEGN